MELTEIESKVTAAVGRVSESLVSINSMRIERRFPYGSVPLEGQGSGFVLYRNGLIITNNHVVDGATRVQVSLPDGRTFVGEVVGSDEATDVAVVKVDANDLPAAELGNSEALRVGQFVLAVGNALGLPGGPTVSMGVLSAMGRPLPGSDFIFEGLLQTDAAVNPGNSGGPLADLGGRVIGINTAMIPFAQGMGFSIPINTVKRIAGEILEKGRVTRPWIGISGMDLSPQVSRRYGIGTEKGMLVVELFPGSPAEAGGLKVGDAIVKAGETSVASTKDLLYSLSRVAIGDPLALVVLRGGSMLQLMIRPGEAPPIRSYGRR